jgi:hypothetical protein
MVAYQFYCRDPIKEHQLIGVLPERRRTPTRITQASLMNWVKKVFSNYLRSNGIDFFQVTINEFPGKIFQLIPVSISQSDSVFRFLESLGTQEEV